MKSWLAKVSSGKQVSFLDGTTCFHIIGALVKEIEFFHPDSFNYRK